VSYQGRRSPLPWLGAVLALYLVVPLVAFVWRFGTSSDRGFSAPGLWDAVGTSAVSATISTLLITLFGVPLACWLARSRSAAAGVVGTLVQLPLALPPVMSGIVLVYLVGPYTDLGRFFAGGLTDSLVGVVLAQTFVAAPFLVIAARSAFAAVDPALDELAASLGHRPPARFARVWLHGAAAGIRAGMLLTWLRALGEYGATVLLAYHPYSLPVFTSVQFSSTGIPSTQAPTAVALALAALGLLLSSARRPRRLRRPVQLPEPTPPPPASPATVAFDLDAAVGTFGLRIAHAARTHRVAILGASGSGKSMTLRAVAGLLGRDAGHVEVDGRDVSRLPAEARGIGWVPQGGRLFPGRTVWQQVTFGVGADPGVAVWWLEILGLRELADRLPGELSGGQRQRVSLAQALSRAPRLVLLDEPFSALDAPVRSELRLELRRLQREAGVSTVLVTHDVEEAALLADELLVIAEGRLLQAGPRGDVHERPATPQAARLLGCTNLHRGVVDRDGTLRAGGVALDLLPPGPQPGPVFWSVRPDKVHLAEDGFPGRVADVVDLGMTTMTTVRIGDVELIARTADPGGPAAGDACRVRLDPADLLVWPDREAPPSREDAERLDAARAAR
jgi:ABC-type sulfate/molybdate transport systems ATPase subunit/ABC-type sulfate transport system permease component